MTDRMSAAEFRAMQLGQKKADKAAKKDPKYRNRKVEQDGVTFDSEKELKRWNELCMLARAGQITELKRQVSFELAPAADLGEARIKPAIRYFADFSYKRDGQLVVEDVKSVITRKLQGYRIKRHLMKTVHGILVVEI